MKDKTPQEIAKEMVDDYLLMLKSGGVVGSPALKAAKLGSICAADTLLEYSIGHGFIGLTEKLNEVKIEIEKL